MILPGLLAAALTGAPRGATMVAGALAGGYVVGSLPVAWILVRRAERRRGDVELLGPGVPGAPPPPRRRPASPRPGALDVLASGGPRTALVLVAVELAKGAVVGLGARTFDDSAWFCATAIAGCVVGDTFPVGVRRGRRGVVPLIAGVWAAMPATWAVGTIIAIPAVLVFVLSGLAFEAVVAVTVPLAFLLGTRDPLTIAPAALIVLAVVARSRLRRLARERAATGRAQLPPQLGSHLYGGRRDPRQGHL